MPINPLLGYDPTPGALGPQTKQQWIAMMTASLTLRFVNGEDMTEPQVSDAYLQSHGYNLGALKAAFGVLKANPKAAIDPYVATAMAQIANDIYTTQGYSLPDTPGSALGPEDQKNIAAATASANQDKAAGERQAAADAAAKERANIAAAASHDTANISANASRDVANINAAVSREQLAADTKQKQADAAEKAREFDLTRADQRAQFNATMLSDLLKTGAQLAAHPVDWVAHQYFMANLSIPLSALNIGASAMLFGAIPPSGPSAAGPVVGGPAAMDGNLQLSQQLGIQNAGFVPVTQAVAALPGSGADFNVPQYTATATAEQLSQQLGGPQQLDAAVSQAQAKELPQALGSNPITDSAHWQQAAATPATQPMPEGQPQLGAAQPQLPSVGGPGSFAGPQPQAMPAATPATTAPGAQQTSTGGSDHGIYTGVSATAPQTQSPFGAANPWAGGPGITATTPAVTPGATPGAQPAPGTGAAQPGTPAQNPQGEALLNAISQQTGIPIDQLRGVLDPTLLAGGYSPETLAKMPVIQSLQNPAGGALPAFRTASAVGQKFGTIQALGIPLGNQQVGFRGGQDLNAGTFLQANPSSKDMIQGAVEGTGQDWRDVLHQSLRTAPVTNYQPGAFGRRVF